MSGKRRVWQDNEIAILLKSWKDHVHMNYFFQKQCIGKSLFLAIYKDLRNAGHHRLLMEIVHKTKNMARCFRFAKVSGTGASGFGWYHEVEEILAMEKTTRYYRDSFKPHRELMEKLYGHYVEENIPGSTQADKTNVLDDESDSDSELLFYNTTKHDKPEVQNNTQGSLPQLPGSNSEKSSETILQNICKEFQISNRQFEANDQIILELFKKQNNIFRKQTALLRKLIKND